MANLAKLKKDPIFTDSQYSVSAPSEDVLLAVHEKGKEKMVGIFCVTGREAEVSVPLADGSYPELLGGGTVDVQNGSVRTAGTPLAIKNLILE